MRPPSQNWPRAGLGSASSRWKKTKAKGTRDNIDTNNKPSFSVMDWLSM